MKLAAVVDSPLNIGGGFSQAMAAILQLQKLSRGKFDLLVVTSRRENVENLKNLGIEASYSKVSIYDKILAFLGLTIVGRSVIGRSFLIGPFEKHLIGQGCDLVYFTMPSYLVRCLTRLNYIVTIWDVCHRDFPEFPEVRGNQFLKRELFVSSCLPSAYKVIVDSEQLSDLICHRYGLDKERIIAMPFSPTPFLNAANAGSVEQVLNLYKLEPGYLFYPAQFWAHKNHVRLLEAMALLAQEQVPVRLVFCGGDYGNLAYVKKQAALLGVADNVAFIGFVPGEHVQALYRGARAVVMPTYFGPTNIPPLEAWAMGKPLIYSSHLAGQVQDAALLADPDDAAAWANSIKMLLDDEVIGDLIRKGNQRLASIEKTRLAAEHELMSAIERFAKRRKCWN